MKCSRPSLTSGQGNERGVERSCRVPEMAGIELYSAAAEGPNEARDDGADLCSVNV